MARDEERIRALTAEYDELRERQQKMLEELREIQQRMGDITLQIIDVTRE